jgi:hypothetical protein
MCARSGNTQESGDGYRTHPRGLTDGPVLIGTWSDATWAIRFSEKHGFHRVGPEEKNRLAKAYWTLPDAQMAVSVVLADHKCAREDDKRLVL